MLNKKFYNVFHKSNKVQAKPIKENNFTYINLLNVLNTFISSDCEKNTLLDLGCGSGVLSIYLAPLFKKIIAIDISNVAISIAKNSINTNKIHNVTFKQMEFPKEYPLGKYNYIICFEVLEHIRDDKKALKIIYRLLDNKGLAFISVPSSNAPLYKLGLANNFDRKVGHLRRYTMTQIIQLCEQTGFKIVDARLSEGIIRNSLFLIPMFSIILKFIKSFIVKIMISIDNISLKLFGESQIIIVVKK